MLNYRPGYTLAIAFCACITLSACVSRQRIANAVIDASRRNEPLPLAHLIDETLTIDEAYRIQQHVVKELLDDVQPGGFKAGLTSPQSQARFGTNEPVAGVLPPDGLRHPGATFRLSELRGLNFETEVALRIGKPVRERIGSIEELKRHVDGIAPAIELPNLHYVSGAQPGALDIIATNVAAAAYIVGDFASPDSRDPNDATPQLVCNGREVNSGRARDALGDQWEAARWLVNTMLQQGWSIEKGQILLTGALGRMIPALPGDCSADYGSWGTIAFHVVQ